MKRTIEGVDSSCNARAARLRGEESIAVEVVGSSVHVGELVNVLELKLGKPAASHQELCGDSLATCALFFARTARNYACPSHVSVCCTMLCDNEQLPKERQACLPFSKTARVD